MWDSKLAFKNSGIANKRFRSFSSLFHLSHILSLKYMIFLPHLVSAEHKNFRPHPKPSCIWVQMSSKGRLQDYWTAEACPFLTCQWPCLGFSSSFSNPPTLPFGRRAGKNRSWVSSTISATFLKRQRTRTPELIKIKGKNASGTSHFYQWWMLIRTYMSHPQTPTVLTSWTLSASRLSLRALRSSAQVKRNQA